MKVRDLMTTRVYSCRPGDTLRQAAQLMWEHDCGCVPVVGDSGEVLGIITDRDGFIAAYVRGQPLDQIAVRTAMAHKVLVCREDDAIDTAERILRDGQVRRLPVIDAAGHLVGILSLNDLAQRATPSSWGDGDGLSGDAIALTVAAIGRPRVRGVLAATNAR
jgi:CBS-domain-containing membrane protein